MQKLFFLVVITATAFFSKAQTRELIVKSGDKGLYLDHKVAPKEGLYAIGRLYNVNPKFIAMYNKIDLNAGLNIGQTLRIPLTDTNFTQKGNTGTPVYYKTGNNENLQKTSNANKNVAIQSLRDWNGLANDNLQAGTKLIIGFLQSKEMPSITVNNQVKKPEPVKPVEEKPVVKKEVKPEIKEEPKNTKPENTNSAIVKAEVKPEIKEEVKKTEPGIINTPAVKEEIKAVSSEAGYFKAYFDQQVKASPASKNSTLTSGIFKTTSGWQDAKYYLLINGVSPGTIIKITNPDNNKAVYAKVLGEMNGIHQNQGLDIRISNAAASALQVSEQEKFVVKVNY